MGLGRRGKRHGMSREAPGLALTGGDLNEARLPEYPVAKDKPDTKVELLSPAPERWAVFQSGLRAADGEMPVLTGREQEVLSLVAGGATDMEIADALCLSVHTVKSHMRNILAKLHLSHRHEAAQFALRQGLIPPLK